MKKKQVVVFDFDETITEKHLWKFLYKHENSKYFLHLFNSGSESAARWVRDEIFGGNARINSLKKYFESIVSQDDVDLSISSHGLLSDITKALSYTDIHLETFKFIHGRMQFCIVKTNEIIDTPLDKQYVIENLLLNKYGYDHAIFVDEIAKDRNRLVF